MTRTGWAALAVLGVVAGLSVACGETSEEREQDAGLGGSEGDGMPSISALPDPAIILAPALYDCSASEPPVPPERPHASNCFADSACASRLVAGHRMAVSFAPENTLSALRAAILLGVDLAETDVRLTADGEIVLLHDAEIDRTVEGSGKVEELTLAELQALPVKTQGRPGNFSCDRVPTLDEALAVSRGKIVLELEVKTTEAGVAAAQVLRARNLYGEAFLLCDRDECEAVRAAVPDAPIMSRPRKPAEVARELDYAPPPLLVHIDPTQGFLAPEIVASVHDGGAKLYGNAFIDADSAAVLSRRGDAYVELYDRGLQVLQAQFPEWALIAIGRGLPSRPEAP